VEEQLGIFLYTCVTGLSSCHVGERFQHFPDTVTRYSKQLLFFFSSSLDVNGSIVGLLELYASSICIKLSGLDAS
ncbi:hypothetical protein PAXRUDRAFT_155677, partial [Paxillus rubicundulus Ve08.2h10]